MGSENLIWIENSFQLGDLRLFFHLRAHHCFKPFGVFLSVDGDIHQDVTHRIKCEWHKWRVAIGILCIRGVLLKFLSNDH